VVEKRAAAQTEREDEDECHRLGFHKRIEVSKHVRPGLYTRFRSLSASILAWRHTAFGNIRLAHQPGRFKLGMQRWGRTGFDL